MEVTATYDQAGWVRAYLTLWQGMLGLTEKELELTALLCERHLLLVKSVTDESLRAELFLSAGTRAALREQLGMSANNLQNYLSFLKEKRVLLQTKEGNYSLHPKLIPQKSITFTFNITE